MDKIFFTEPPHIPAEIVSTLAENLGLTRPKTKSWMKKHIFNVVKSDVMYADGIPHLYKDSTHRFVIRVLTENGVPKDLAEEFFHANYAFGKDESIGASDIEWAETADKWAERLAKETLKDNPELFEILKNEIQQEH
jgi:hypothetical protein